MLPLMRSRSPAAVSCGGQIGGRMARNVGLDLIEHRDGRADLPGRAIAALVAVMLDAGRLHRVPRRAEALNGRDGVPLVHDRKREAGSDAPAIDQDRARTALALIA